MLKTSLSHSVTPPQSRSHDGRSGVAASSGLRRVVARLGFCALLLCLFCAPAEAAGVRGTVLNKGTHNFLERALVQIRGTKFTALTDKNGSFLIVDVPAGSYSLVASYAGLDDASKTIRIVADETCKVDFELTSDVYMLDAVVVTSAVEGNAYAINQQHRAESQRSVASIDAYGDNVSSNPGEFLRNMVGVQIDYNEAEANGIRVRGFDSNLTGVMMDGNQVASASSSSTNRSIGIDQLSLGTIESVEVFKASLPSMAANSIGGSVNFVTRSAFSQKGRRADLVLGLTANSKQMNFSKSAGGGHGDKPERKIMPSAVLNYSNSFLGNRVGIVASLLYEKQWIPSNGESHNLNIEGLPDPSINPAKPTTLYFPQAPAPYTINNTRIRRRDFVIDTNQQYISRAGASINTDFKLTDELVFTLKSSFTDYHSTNRNHKFTIQPGTPLAGFTPTEYTTTNATLLQGGSIFDKYSKTWTLSPRLSFKSAAWKVDAIGGYSKSKNQYDNPDTFSALNLKLTGIGLTMITPLDTDLPSSIVQNSGPGIYNINSYRVSQSVLPANNIPNARSSAFVEKDVRRSIDTVYSGKLDVRRDISLRFPLQLQAGLSYNLQVRDKEQPRERWNWVGPDGIYKTADDVGPDGKPDTADDNAAFDMSVFEEPSPVLLDFGGLPSPSFISSRRVNDYFVANPQAFLYNEAFALQQRIVGKRKISEELKSAYIMGNLKIHKLSILTGARIEETGIESTGSSLDRRIIVPSGQDAESLEWIQKRYKQATDTASYRTPVLKYLHLKYEWTPTLQTRASYTESIGRPNFTDVLPNTVLDPISVNNKGVVTRAPLATLVLSNLEPEFAQSYDISLEYYPKNAGVWSVSWFHKNITNKLQNIAVGDFVTGLQDEALMTELGIPPEYLGYYVTLKKNDGYATWNGLEIDMRQKLRDWKALPEFLHGIEVFANHTYVYKMEGDYGMSGRLITQLRSVVPKIYNAGISYRTPKGRFYAQVTTNYQSAKPGDDLPPVTNNDLTRSNSAQVDRWTKSYQFWNLSATYRLTPSAQLIFTARNITGARTISTQTGGIVVDRSNDSGTFWKISTKIEF